MKPDPIQVLREIQWSSYRRDRNGDIEDCCPVCSGTSGSHSSTCELAECLALPQSEEPVPELSAVAAAREDAKQSLGTLRETINLRAERRASQPVPASADRVRGANEDTLQHICSLIGEGDSVSDRAGRRSAKRAVRRLCNRIIALETALLATPEQGRVEERNPDHVYDKADWEWTSTWDDRNTLTDALNVGEIIHVGTLYSGPDKWACRIDETEVRWFDAKEEAEAALAPRATTDHEGEADV